jgi:hypothetical protein
MERRKEGRREEEREEGKEGGKGGRLEAPLPTPALRHCHVPDQFYNVLNHDIIIFCYIPGRDMRSSVPWGGITLMNQ